MTDTSDTLTYSSISPLCVLLQIKNCKYYVRVPEEMSDKLKDENFLVSVAVALLGYPSQDESEDFVPYVYKEEDRLQILVPPPEANKENDSCVSVETLSTSLKDWSPMKSVKRSQDLKEPSPLRKRLDCKATPSKGLFKEAKASAACTDEEETQKGGEDGIAPLPDEGTTVRFTNVEEDTYEEEHFLKIVRKKCCVPDTVPLKSSPYTSAGVLVHFPSSAIAEKVLKYSPILYQEQKVSMCVVQQQSLQHRQTKFVEFSGVMDTYTEKHFLKVLQKKLGIASELPLNCSSYKDGVVIVEFPSNEKAENAATLEVMTYDEGKVSVKLHYSEGCMGPTRFVKISNVADTYVESNFVKVLRRKLGLDHTVSVVCSEACTGVVVVEFPSIEMALDAVRMGTFTYDEEEATVQSFRPAEQQKINETSSSELVHEDPDALRTPVFNLKKDQHITAFLYECLDVMERAPFRGTVASLDIVTERLETQRIFVSIADCRSRWKTLGDQYRKEKNVPNSTWRHFEMMAELKGDAPKKKGPASKTQGTAVPGTAPKPTVSKTEKVATITRGKIWYDAPTRRLIQLREKYQHKFDAVGADMRIWDTISKDLVGFTFHYSPQQCKDRWDDLLEDMKDALENKTGQGPKNFDYLAEMEFCRKWVSVEPKLTISFGCSAVRSGSLHSGSGK